MDSSRDSLTDRASASVSSLSSCDTTVKDDTKAAEAGAHATPDLEKGLQNLERKPLAELRYKDFNTYKRLCSLIIVGNLAATIIILTRAGIERNMPTLASLCIHMGAANTMVCSLIRSPIIINILFSLFSAIPRSAPLRLRRICCKVFHLGGVHSGTGTSALIWFIGFLISYTMSKPWENPRPAAVFGLALAVMVLLLSIVVVAIPGFRRRFHDTFELTHRFAGWATLVLFWALLFLHAYDEAVVGNTTSVTSFLVTFPTFWFLSVSTVAAIWPWTMLRKVDVTPEKLSAHATRLHLHHLPDMGFGQGLSLAKHPLKDWHSFAAFTDRFDTSTPGFSCLVSNAGNWTGSVIQGGPTQIWVRGIPVCGFGHVMKMFHRIIMVTTGSGIGPCLSFIGDENRPAMRVVWQTRSPLRTYGQRTVNLVKRLDQDPVILDTDVLGRVDMLPLIRDMAKEFEAEAVCVISNPRLTARLVFELESTGIPAYGPIFDS
ncbi:hypothetical protein JX265_000224 [Neoarthrinium moseri]|uniref:Integral membrane protein TmpA n=1 Tax=Neoarthrinium moseri TaxID=1658444 RepID=A0A9Q0AS21_9PEZI|nr:hypothetical protein JX265_000224 [Neoarthrinium moseri]